MGMWMKLTDPPPYRSADMYTHSLLWCQILIQAVYSYVPSIRPVRFSLFSMDNKLSEVCPRCRTTVHVRRAVYGCGHVFPSKRKAQSGSMSQALKHRRADRLHKALMWEPLEHLSNCSNCCVRARLVLLAPSMMHGPVMCTTCSFWAKGLLSILTFLQVMQVCIPCRGRAYRQDTPR